MKAASTLRTSCYSAAKTMLKRHLATLGFMLCLVISQAWAAGWRDALPQARVVGQGEFHWFGFSIYSAHLWAETPAVDWVNPFALELVYHRSISRTRFVDVSADEIERVGNGRYSAAQLERWRSLMSQSFVDVNSGDTLVGVYVPGVGCRFYDGSKLLASVDDPAFARAFFSIWLDPRTRDTGLREKLLGKQRSP